MKATFLAGRVDKAGKHNDRNFDVSLAEHIDPSRMEENKYWTYNGSKGTFEQVELEFYTSHFYKHVNEQNKRNEATGHAERNRTVEDYMKNKSTRPEDIIIQIGDKDNHVDGEQLWDCVLEFQRQFDEVYGDHCKIVDMALHLDETTPHVHIRRVWISEDNYGCPCVSENKALKDMGIVSPNFESRQSKVNNPKVTFTAIERKMFEDICMDRGFNIEINNRNRTEHLSIKDYKLTQKIKESKKKLEEIERQRVYTKQEIQLAGEIVETANDFIESTFDMFQNNAYFMQMYEDELEEIRKQQEKENLSQLYYLYVQLFEKAFLDVVQSKDFEKAAIRADVESQYERMKRFIKQKGLEEEFEQYKERNTQKEHQKEKKKR